MTGFNFYKLLRTNTRTHTHTRTCMHIRTHTRMYTHTCTCMHTRAHTHTKAQMTKGLDHLFQESPSSERKTLVVLTAQSSLLGPVGEKVHQAGDAASGGINQTVVQCISHAPSQLVVLIS